MSDFIPDIRAFCCHYTSQQSCDEGADLKGNGFPDNIALTRVVCTGKLQVSTMLQAFEDGADGVYVAGCLEGECHYINGNIKARKRVQHVKNILAELGIEPERVEMFNLSAGEGPRFAAIANEMDKRIRELGPSPVKTGATKKAA